MTSNTLQPELPLTNWVARIEVFESQTAATLPFYADGYPGIIFHQTENGLYFDGSNKQPPLFLYGQTVKPVLMSLAGPFKVIVFYLYPYAIKSLFRFGAHELTDGCLDLGLHATASFKPAVEAIQEATITEHQVAAISKYLLAVIERQRILVDTTIQYAVNRITKTNGQVSLKELRNMLFVTERTFERRFEQHVGISPKLFARICQFHASRQQLHQHDYLKMSDLAYGNGYTDQSHFIRSFREFTGVAPLEYRRQQEAFMSAAI